MARVEINFQSAVLNRAVACYAIVPEKVRARNLPVLYLLHGYSDDYTIWLRRTGLERYVDGREIIVVMPDGGHEFYVDARIGYRYETFLMEELIPRMEVWLPAAGRRNRRGIGGLSMGGYGAVRLGLKYPGHFATVHGHSGAYDIGRRLRDGGLTEVPRVFGASVAGTDRDIFHLVDTVPRKGLPAFHLDCGRSDHCLADNRKLVKALKQRGIPHTYREHAGAHNWDYWDTHIREAVDFHLKHWK